MVVISMGKEFPPLPALAVRTGCPAYCQEQVPQENAMAKKLVHCVEGQ
jgi:hypothetical protein